MYIKTVTIKNFKAIKYMELTLKPGVNLLLGDNGVGKTSVLEAVVAALYGMLKGVKGVPTKSILQNDIHFIIEEQGDASTGIRYVTPTEVSCVLQNEERQYIWKRIRADENGNTRTKMENDEIEKWMQKISNDTEAVLPLICFQSDARVWQMRRGDYGKELKKQLNDRRCGYIGCLDYSLDIKGIQQWCLKMELNAFQKKRTIREYEAFKSIVSFFMKKVNGLEKAPEVYYSSQLEEMVYHEENMIMPISNLSAGYQSLLWMVMNLAYRLALLNPDISEDLCSVPGIVLIDEIDMHLHPKWQWNVIHALEETFPNIQFILATHSPLVISSCNNKQLILITEDKQVMYLEDAYGYSVQDVLKFRQGTTEKPKEISVLSEKFQDSLDKEDFTEAQHIIEQMKQILGERHADVISAQSELELNRWEEL